MHPILMLQITFGYIKLTLFELLNHKNQGCKHNHNHVIFGLASQIHQKLKTLVI